MKVASLIDFPRSTLCLCTLLAGAAPLQSQSASELQQGAVPREFAQVLLTYGRGELRIGRMPENLPTADQLAADARVIGSVIWPDRSQSAIAVREPPSDARRPFEARLRAAGWTERPPPDQLERGFLPAYTSHPARGFCWPATDAQLSVDVRRAPDGGSYILINHYAGGRCAAPPAEQPWYTVLQSLMPSLRPPDGTEFMGSSGGGGGGGDEYETRITVT